MRTSIFAATCEYMYNMLFDWLNGSICNIREKEPDYDETH